MGHRNQFGHEFLEFEFQEGGKLRYANQSNYRIDQRTNDRSGGIIKKEGTLTTFARPCSFVSLVNLQPHIQQELARIIEQSQILG